MASQSSDVLPDPELLSKAMDILHALDNKKRLQILSFIWDEGSIIVNDICTHVDQEQSMVSQHLRILRTTHLVNRERDGRFIHYSTNLSSLTRVQKALAKFCTE